MRSKPLKLVTITLLGTAMMALFPACSSTHIRSARNPAANAAAPFHRVMVVGVDARSDFREGFENDVVRALKERGVEGTTSYASFSVDEMKGDREQLRLRLVAANAESVLVVRVTGQTDFVTGSPAGLGSMDMGSVDDFRYNHFTTSGGELDTDVRLGARFLRVSDGMVIWSALVDEVLKEDYDSIVVLRGVAKTIVDRLAKDKVIP